VTLLGLGWHPAIERSTGGGVSVIEGYGVGHEQASTDDWRDREDDQSWQAWALELTVKVGGDVARGSHDLVWGLTAADAVSSRSADPAQIRSE